MQRFLTYIDSRLGTIYSKNELRSISRLLLMQLAGMSSVQIYSDKDTKFPDDILTLLKTSVDRLFSGEPIQYILGEAEFFELNFKVRPGVLIPRPETEELVELVLTDFKNQNKPIRLLDIGTGSGCIAVTLAKKLFDSKITAWDISEEALKIARENAALNGVSVDFQSVDILSMDVFKKETDQWDVIVSNPPYVCESEKTDMEVHVLNHEPHLALFVNDNDPLIFYRVISLYAVNKLKKGGILYFEINSHLGKDTLELVQQLPFEKVELFQDLSGRDRMIRAIL